jgi:beta-lactamase regulating signal transducer with metallopeptidase domain
VSLGVHQASTPMDPTPSEDQAVITWTVPMMKRFKRAIKQAQDDNLDTFEFDGHQFVRRYAEYLLEYLQTKLTT